MSAPLFDPPPTAPLPVSWQGDLIVTFERFDPDQAELDPPVWEPLDYPADVVGWLIIKSRPDLIRIRAVISGNRATCRAPSEVVDQLRGGELWVFVESYPRDPSPGDPDLFDDIPVVNGEVERHDGAAQ